MVSPRGALWEHVASVTAVGVAAFHAVLTRHFEGTVSPELLTVTGAVLLAINAGRLLAGRPGLPAALGPLIVLAGLAFVGRVLPAAALSPAVTAAAAGGAACWAVNLVALFRADARGGAAATGFGLLLAGVVAGQLWGYGSHTPVFTTGIENGRTHIDPLFHTAIVAMIQTHGVSTVGIDGVVRLPYHVGSHWLLAHLTVTFGVTRVEAYSLVCPILVPALFVWSLGCLARAVAGAHSPAAAETDHRWGPAVVVLAFSNILPQNVAREIGVWYSFWGAESCGVAATLWFLSMALWLTLWARHQRTGAAAPLWVMAASAPPLVAAVAACKVSVGFVCVGLLAAAVVRVPGLRRPATVLGAAAALAVAYAVYKWASPPYYATETSHVVWFAFVRSFVPAGWWPWIFWIHLAWFLALAAGRLYALGAVTAGDAVRLARAGRVIDVELAAVAVGLSFAPGLLMDLAAGAAWFFWDCQRWLCLALLLGWLAARQAAAPAAPPRRWADIRLRDIFVRAVVACLVFEVALNTLYTVRQAVAVAWSRLLDRQNPAGDAAFDGWPGTQQALEDLVTFKPPRRVLGVSGTLPRVPRPNARIVALLRELDGLNAADKRRTALYIPKATRAYWDMFGHGYTMKGVPFVAPGLSGIAMIDGLPEYNPDIPWIGYGYDIHKPPTEKAAPAAWDADRKGVLARAAAAGFDRVLVVREMPDGELVTVEWPVTASP